MQYHGFDVGPFELKVQVRPGDNIAELWAAAMEVLDALAQQEYAAKRDAFLKRVKGVKV